MRAAHLSAFVLAIVSLLGNAVAQSPAKPAKATVLHKKVAMRHVGASNQSATPVAKKAVSRSSKRRFAKVHYRHR